MSMLWLYTTDPVQLVCIAFVGGLVFGTALGAAMFLQPPKPRQ